MYSHYKQLLKPELVLVNPTSAQIKGLFPHLEPQRAQSLCSPSQGIRYIATPPLQMQGVYHILAASFQESVVLLTYVACLPQDHIRWRNQPCFALKEVLEFASADQWASKLKPIPESKPAVNYVLFDAKGNPFYLYTLTHKPFEEITKDPSALSSTLERSTIKTSLDGILITEQSYRKPQKTLLCCSICGDIVLSGNCACQNISTQGDTQTTLLPANIERYLQACGHPIEKLAERRSTQHASKPRVTLLPVPA